MASRGAKSFGRSAAKYKPEPTVLIVCEDSKAGKTYLEDAAIHFRVNVVVSVVHIGNTDPLGIVKEAERKIKNFDKIFCVVDRDSHENFDQASRLAAKHDKIDFIASYPCSEYWYLLHFCKQRREYGRAGNKSPGDQQVSSLREHIPKYGKASVGLFEDLILRLPDAKLNAEWAMGEAVRDGNLNPSTRLHDLISYIESLQILKPL